MFQGVVYQLAAEAASLIGKETNEHRTPACHA